MTLNLTTEHFIEKAKLVHGDKYDYSLVEYTNWNEGVEIKCPTHNIFTQKAGIHLSGSGCPECANVKPLTTETFIKKSKLIYGDKYDYSLVDYKNMLTKVKIICSEHGIFEQAPSNHLSGGCKKCAMHILNESKRFSKEEMIVKFKKIHGNKYDYSLVEYKSITSKIKIVCPKHGIFEQSPICHLNWNGCKKCSQEEKFKENKLKFVKKANKVHNNKYDYSLVEYKGNHIKVKIICSEHGIFEQEPNTHLNGCGCPNCSIFKKDTRDTFIQKSNMLWNYRYDYSLVEYKTSKTKVKIICKEHGPFYQNPNDHLTLHGCAKCKNNKLSIEKMHSKEEFIEKANKVHNNKYSYSLMDYKGIKKKVKLICPIHGVFNQSAGSHLSGRGCMKCCIDLRKTLNLKTTETFIKDAINVHNYKYDYSLVKYKGNKRKVCIICPKHGKFEQNPNAHLNGSGCPNCNSSLGEIKIKNILTINNIKHIPQYKFDDCKYKIKLRFDFYLPDYNICIEYDGIQHFKSIPYFGGNKAFKERIYVDKIKTDYCKNNNIPLYRINYKDDVEIKMKEILNLLNNQSLK